jgi:hypothetical protein
MCISLKDLTAKNLKRFLKPNRLNLLIFVIIAAVHIVLSFALAAQSFAYSIFISMLYALFNFPVFITSFSLSGYNIYTLSTASIVLPLIVTAIYWYIVACFIRMPLITKNKTLRYKYALYIVSAFLLFAILSVIWFSLSLGTVYLFY